MNLPFDLLAPLEEAGLRARVEEGGPFSAWIAGEKP